MASGSISSASLPQPCSRMTIGAALDVGSYQANSRFSPTI
jgi:hypothetical protein